MRRQKGTYISGTKGSIAKTILGNEIESSYFFSSYFFLEITFAIYQRTQVAQVPFLFIFMRLFENLPVLWDWYLLFKKKWIDRSKFTENNKSEQDIFYGDLDYEYGYAVSQTTQTTKFIKCCAQAGNSKKDAQGPFLWQSKIHLHDQNHIKGVLQVSFLVHVINRLSILVNHSEHFLHK